MGQTYDNPVILKHKGGFLVIREKPTNSLKQNQKHLFLLKVILKH